MVEDLGVTCPRITYRRRASECRKTKKDPNLYPVNVSCDHVAHVDQNNNNMQQPKI